jgi:SPP1 gp7 family putative phage head morphogenesis protein
MPKMRTLPWSNKARKGILKGNALNPSAAIEQRYYTALRVLIDRMTAETDLELRKLFKTEHAEEFFAQDASISSQARILTNALLKKYTDLFASVSKPMAERFAEESNQSSDLAVKSSLRQLSDDLTLSSKTITSGPLNDILNATVTENVGLIKSIPAKYLGGVQGAVMRSITTGNGRQDLVPYLQKHKGITLRRARMIAQDQTKKAFSGLSKGRMQAIGVQAYEWLHTSGSRQPRKLHIQMSGTIYRYDDPPVIDEKTGERGIPGQAINCACRMRPILNFGEQ